MVPPATEFTKLRAISFQKPNIDTLLPDEQPITQLCHRNKYSTNFFESSISSPRNLRPRSSSVADRDRRPAVGRGRSAASSRGAGTRSSGETSEIRRCDRQHPGRQARQNRKSVHYNVVASKATTSNEGGGASRPIQASVGHHDVQGQQMTVRQARQVAAGGPPMHACTSACMGGPPTRPINSFSYGVQCPGGANLHARKSPICGNLFVCAECSESCLFGARTRTGTNPIQIE